MQAIILANGDFPTKSDLIAQIKKAPYLIVCDGAIKHLTKLKIKPNAIIGDLDSITRYFKQKFKEQIIHIAEQETNDLTKAFHHCQTLGFDTITIFGATGKREDHTLANIFLLTYYAKYVKNIVIKSDFGEFSIHNTPCEIKTFKGQQISIFSLDTTCKLTSYNLKYPLKKLGLQALYSGTLNESLGTSFKLYASKNTQIIIYKAYKT